MVCGTSNGPIQPKHGIKDINQKVGRHELLIGFNKMADYVIGTDIFKRNLDDWLFKNDQANANFLFINRNKIPQVFRSYRQKLYRGMYMDDDMLEKLNDSGFLTLNKHTSWSKDENIATKFITDDKFSLGRSNIDKKKVIINKIIPTSSQILDIDSFVLFMGAQQMIMLGYDEMNIDSAIKEKEVLISKGIRVSKSEIKIVN